MDKDLRALLLTGLAALVFLFVGRVVASAISDEDGATRAAALALRQLAPGNEAGSRPEPAAVSAAVALRSGLAAELAALVPTIAYRQPDEFDVPEGQSADLRYIEVLRREQEQLVQGARFVGKLVPGDLGMPVPNPTGLEDVREALRALHVVRCVVTAALDSDVQAVESIRLPKGERRRAKGGVLVRTHPVEFELRGSPAALQATLATLAARPPWLALDELALAVEDNSDGQLATARFTAAALSFDQEQLAKLEVLP